MFNFTTVPPLALYVHFPWCVRKCPYCDFNSHVGGDELPEAAYVDALLADLELELPRVWGRKIGSVFIGGGTPSLMSPEALSRLFSGLRARLPILPDAEITLEANPGTVEQQRFAEFRDAGINRLSIGIQSFNDAKLQALGRIHDSHQAHRAVEAAHAAGFENFNLDLMFGLPGQSLAEAMADVSAAIALQPTHLSYYQLTIEANTAFAHEPPVVPEDDALWSIYSEGQARLADAGYRQYEVSAYAQPGRECRHNRNYWEFGDYLGIGAGAHGKITEAALQRISRRWRVRHPKAYLESAGTEVAVAGESALGQCDAAFDFMLNALRLRDGFATALFEERTGLPITIIQQPLEAAMAKGLLHWDRRRIEPTERGRNYLNNLLEMFLPDDIDG